MRHLIVDNTTKVVINAVLWDGVEPWAPPAGTVAVPSNSADITQVLAPEEFEALVLAGPSVLALSAAEVE